MVNKFRKISRRLKCVSLEIYYYKKFAIVYCRVLAMNQNHGGKPLFFY